MSVAHSSLALSPYLYSERHLLVVAVAMQESTTIVLQSAKEQQCHLQAIPTLMAALVVDSRHFCPSAAFGGGGLICPPSPPQSGSASMPPVDPLFLYIASQAASEIRVGLSLFRCGPRSWRACGKHCGS